MNLVHLVKKEPIYNHENLGNARLTPTIKQKDSKLIRPTLKKPAITNPNTEFASSSSFLMIILPEDTSSSSLVIHTLIVIQPCHSSRRRKFIWSADKYAACDKITAPDLLGDVRHIVLEVVPKLL